MSRIWAGRRCLVTGGAGFGGSHLVAELLARSAEVVVLDRKPRPTGHPGYPDDAVDHVTGDVRDEALVRSVLRSRRVDTVFHLAAEALVPDSIVRPADVLDTNSRGTFVLLEACRQDRPDATFVLASSGAYYGDTASADPLPETAAPRPAANLYAASKAGADLAVQGYARTFGMRASVCRFMNTYGPGDSHRSRLVPRALSLLAAGEPYDFGDRDDGSTRLDFLYVGDMAGAYLATAEHLERAPGDVFNFGSGRCTGIREVAVLTSRSYDGVDREPIFHGAPRRPSKQKWLDISRARSVLGWRPTVGLGEGLARTVRWHRERNGPP